MPHPTRRRPRLLESPALALASLAFASATTATGADTAKLPVWRERMARITPHTYVARHTANPPAIDGRLDDAAWAAAPWTADFVDIEGDAKARPRFRTRAKLLWDDTHLYIAAELEEPHLWAKLTQHDAVIFHDPDFEVFVDPEGDTHHYFEFELNALNTGWDLFLPKPYMDGGKARNDWEIPGLKSAVHLRGTLNDPRDTDTGWTLEIAFPWAAFVPPGGTPTTPRRAPENEAVWRMNFSRVQWHVSTASGGYEKLPGKPEDNWVWSPQGVIDMHRPEMWGRVLFTRKPAGEAAAVPRVFSPDDRLIALDFYYAQLDFHRTHKRWAATFAELNWTPPLTVTVGAPLFRLTPDGYDFAWVFHGGIREWAWWVRHDRLLRLQRADGVKRDFGVPP
ncbi:MAG: carbohydrate-binding family 9-like protein [Opitutaceae bacterium]|nr:carbohydrate-binding family 9-like protein [Opitutaceae bacterium]